MSSTIPKSVRLATEATFASIDPATGLPSAAGLVWSSAEFADAPTIVIPGDPILTEDTTPRIGSGRRPPEPATVYSGGVPVQRRNGSITLPLLLRPGLSDAGPTSALWKALRACFPSIVPPTVGGHSDVTIAPVTAGGWTATTAAKYNLGGLVGVGVNGRWDYAGIENKVVAAISLTPALQAAPTAGDVARLLACVGMPGEGMADSTEVDSLAVEMRGDGWEALCFGVEPTNLSLEMAEDSRRLTLTIEANAAHIEYVSAPTAPAQTVPTSGSSIVHQTASFAKIGTATNADDGVPGALNGDTAAYTPCLYGFSLNAAISRSAPACGENITGRSKGEVTDVDLTATLTVDRVLTAPGLGTGLDADIWNRLSRQVLVGFASGQPGSAANGFAVWLPSAFLSTDPAKLDASVEHYRQVLTYRVGPPSAAASGAGALLPAFVLGVGV